MTDKTPDLENKLPVEEIKRLAAVIDIGATAVRMDIAEIDKNGLVRRMESLR